MDPHGNLITSKSPNFFLSLRGSLPMLSTSRLLRSLPFAEEPMSACSSFTFREPARAREAILPGVPETVSGAWNGEHSCTRSIKHFAEFYQKKEYHPLLPLITLSREMDRYERSRGTKHSKPEKHHGNCSSRAQEYVHTVTFSKENGCSHQASITSWIAKVKPPARNKHF